MENCGVSRGFGFIYIYIYRLYNIFKFFWIVLIHGKENVKLENNRIREACKEIIKYYCCNWYGFILGPFHYLTKKKKKKLTCK